MTNKKGPEHVVVDGSNIATEGRSLPSLAQLQDAVMAFMSEHPDTAVTVVVDATFGHRIDKSEVKHFDEGIANNELVAPPAGAVGRGDAFVLGIADKAGATVLSNDSFQEFHGEYGWLFDEGRLVGGKPVPHVGWVFVDRVPVRGPVSRQATGSRGGSKRGSRSKGRKAGKASKAASEPMPVPTSPPPGGKGGSSTSDQPAPAETPAPTPERSSGGGDGGSKRPAPKRGEPVNDVLPFLQFVEHHPIGTSVNGTVDAYSSHGAYISVGDDGVRGYIPLSLMADPPPRSARKQLKIGESVTVVVVSFVPERRSIDCAMPDMVDAAMRELDTDDPAEVEAEIKEAVEATADPAELEAATGAAEAAERPARRRTRKTAAKKTATKKTAAKKTAAKKTAAKKAAARSSTARKSAAKQSAAKRSASKKSAAKKTAAKKAAATSSTAEKSAAEQPAAEAPAAKKAAAKKSAARTRAAKKTASKKSAATKSASKKSTARKRSASRKSAATSTAERTDG